MNMQELQQLKMAWLAAEEAGDTQTRLALLLNHPDLQDALIDFVAAYNVTSSAGTEPDLLPLTKRAMQTAMQRVFTPQTVALPLPAADLRELRSNRGLTLSTAARGLSLGVDVWKKFEDGLIELTSLGDRQLTRLASFFQITSEQFGLLLNQSQPAFTLNRRQTAQAAETAKQSVSKQSFIEALEKSTMSIEEKQSWLAS